MTEIKGKNNKHQHLMSANCDYGPLFAHQRAVQLIVNQWPTSIGDELEMELNIAIMSHYAPLVIKSTSVWELKHVLNLLGFLAASISFNDEKVGRSPYLKNLFMALYEANPGDVTEANVRDVAKRFSENLHCSYWIPKRYQQPWWFQQPIVNLKKRKHEDQDQEQEQGHKAAKIVDVNHEDEKQDGGNQEKAESFNIISIKMALVDVKHEDEKQDGGNQEKAESFYIIIIKMAHNDDDGSATFILPVDQLPLDMLPELEYFRNGTDDHLSSDEDADRFCTLWQRLKSLHFLDT